MAQDEHAKIVRRGAEALQEWRQQNPGVRLDLQDAMLRRADLTHANLSEANLRNANLEWGDLRWADLVEADLSGAVLNRADFHKADLQGADLRRADLTNANLEDANFKDAILAQAIFSHTRMANTDFSGALGLDRTNHPARSEIDDETINKSGGLPDHFLSGCGRHMTYQATVYRVLIGSPSDVQDERRAARDTIRAWNDHHSRYLGAVALPIMWETHATPRLGGSPQEIINPQIVEPSQILVCIFWTRLGTPTDKWESGTAEEIERFLSQGKPVLVYFCKRLLPHNTDVQEWTRLQDFKKKIMNRGLIGEFESPEELTKKLDQRLTETVRGLLAWPDPRGWRR